VSETRIEGSSGSATWISPRFRTQDWKNLNLASSNSSDWSKAVEIFLDRIRGRFLDPVDAIRNHIDPRIAEFAGFTIMAVDCLLIETLVQFRNGQDQTEGKHENAFWEFFHESEFFNHDFDFKKASVFYRHFRCGILHQAQTKGSSLVRYGRHRMVEAVVMVDVEQGLIIDRELFHNALVNEIDSYAHRLRLPQNERDSHLRQQFVKKMNLITI
jgi:hypothetical protein